MAGKELYNIDLNINVNGVDKGISDLKKMDKAVENLEKKSKRLNFGKMGSFSGSLKGFEKANKMMEKTIRQKSKLERSMKKPILAEPLGVKNINNTNSALLRQQKIMQNMAKISANKGMFRNTTAERLMGKAVNYGGTPIQIKATENVTQTVNKAKSSLQNLKHAANIKTTLKANGNRATQVIANTTRKAKAYASGKYEAVLSAKNTIGNSVFGRAYNGMMSKARRIVGYGATALGGIGITAMIKTFAGYEKQMSAVKAVTRANEKEFAALNQQAQKLGATTEWSAVQVAEGMGNLGQAGFSTQEIIKSMPGLLNMASAGNLGLAEASNIAAGTLRAFNLDVSQTGHVADVLALASSVTNTNVADMGNSMEYAAPFAKALGVSMEDTASAIGMLANVNIKGSKAGMTLRNMFTSLSGPTKEASKIMQEIGFNAFDAQGKMKSFPTLISDLDKATSHLNRQQKAATLNKIFGDIGTTGVLSLLDMGGEKLGKLTKQLEFSQGAAEKMSKVRLDNLAGDFTILKSAIEGTFINAGSKVNGQLRHFVQWLTQQVPKIGEVIGNGLQWIADHGDQIVNTFKTFGPAILGGVAAIETLKGVMFFGQAIRDINSIKNAIMGVATAGGSLGNIAGALGGIGPAASGGIGALSTLKGLLAGLTPVGILGLAVGFSALSLSISDNCSKLGELQDKLGTIGEIGGRIAEGFGGLLKMTLGNAGTFLEGSFEGLAKLLMGDFDGAGATNSRMWADMETNSKQALSDITGRTTKAAKEMRRLTTAELTPMKQSFETVLGEIPNIAKGKYKEMATATSNSIAMMNDNQLNLMRGASVNMNQLLSGVSANMSRFDVAKKIEENMGTLSKTSTFNPQNMIKDFQTAISTIERLSGDAGPRLKQNLSNAFNSFSEIARQGNIRGGIQSMLTEIQSMGPAVQQAILGNKRAMETAFAGVDFSKGINEQVTQVMNNLSNLKVDPSQAVSYMRGIFENLGSQASQQGQEIGRNAKEGIESGMSSLTIGNGTGSLPIFENYKTQAAQQGQEVGQRFSTSMNESMSQAGAQMTGQMTQLSQISQQANMMAQQVKQAYTNMYNGASNSVRSLVSVTTSSFAALSGSAVGQVSAMCSRIIGLWNSMRATVSQTITAHFVLSVSQVGGVGGAIPKHADGGILTKPHIGMVAEAGPEAIIPLSPGSRGRGLEVFNEVASIFGLNKEDTKTPLPQTNTATAVQNRYGQAGESQSPAINVSVNVVNNGGMNKHQLVEHAKEEFARELLAAFDEI